ncbi:transcription factor SPEECHLESS [Helianthus annuus]|uniref:Putative myc-type, basic helix-loop-helix (BHLH) domain-containing protein n=1 Tax=Helianthus annuus TaxID=4232 RepID=A0A251SMR3_HELAN|nr:transcription factor SPEECHLESS [Helianthus annuus]KAJ0487837.1 putative transcription factor bHLH family [Helianthus annuus]
MGGESCVSLTDFFDSYMEAEDTNLISPLGAEDIFSTLQVLEDEFTSMATPQFHANKSNSSSSCIQQQLVGSDIKRKRQSVEDGGDGQQKVAHISVERNRRKQMNEHLTVLRSLLPCFYIKRGDQASIIGVVVDYITELQQVVQSLEAKKQRKVYGDVLSPRPSPRSPRPALPISPTTPQSAVSPYRPRFHQPNPSYLQPSSAASPSTSSSNSDIVSKSSIADVEVKFSGSNLVLKTVSPRLPGQATKIVSVLEDLSFEILHVGINIVDETMVNSFTIKIGIECQLSVEDLVQHVQQTFC